MKPLKTSLIVPPMELNPADHYVCGVFEKKEAAAHIVAGVQHLHSSMLGERDSFARSTREWISQGIVGKYAWETPHQCHEAWVRSSYERADVIKNVVQEIGKTAKRGMREKLESVLEELLSNAIFHAYQTPDGQAKYNRKDSVTLKEAEYIKLNYGVTTDGIYLAVTDRGGDLSFSTIQSSFQRCYGSSANQIESKDGGAGLGLYMAFESTTHTKITKTLQKSTEVACWIAENHVFDPTLFSFNYFERR